MAKRKKNKKRYCCQCRGYIDTSTSKGFKSHFRDTHGRAPTQGELRQSVNFSDTNHSRTEYFGDSPPREGPTVQGGAPGLKK